MTDPTLGWPDHLPPDEDVEMAEMPRPGAAVTFAIIGLMLAVFLPIAAVAKWLAW